MVCKRPRASRTNSLAGKKEPSQGLFLDEKALPQEVSKPTGNTCPFTQRADSQQLAVRELESNPTQKTIKISHPQTLKMEDNARDGGNNSDGKSDSSLLNLLTEITDYPTVTADN